MTAIKLNEHELEAMRGMPHWHRSLYLFGIRPYADYETGRVGHKRRISYQSLREAVEVTPTPGTNEGFYPGRQQIKRALKRLESAGLIALESERKQLILRVELMDTDECGGPEADTRPTQGRHNQGDTEADTQNPANIVSFADRADTQADTRPTQQQNHQADTPSGLRDPGNTSPYGDGATSSGPPPCPHDDIIELYHQILPMCRQVKNWGNNRAKFLRARWREKPQRQSLEYWERLFTYIRDECPFLVGRKPGKDGEPFTVDLEWIVRPNNFYKLVERKYEDNRDAS